MTHLFAAKIALRIGLGLINLAFAAVFLSGVAFAGDQYLDRDGRPVGGYDVVSYHTEAAARPSRSF